nr:RDD family protein [Thermoanaerobacterales bacterium]
MAVQSTDRPDAAGTGPGSGPCGDGHGARTSPVSAYSYPAAAPPQPRGAADPTAVMARRTGAWVVDFLIYLVIMAFLGPTPLSPLAEYYDVEGVDDPCEILQEGDQYDAATCVVVDDRAYVTSSADVAVQIVVSLALFVGYCVLQGATGRTPGKALLGVKVVDERGGNPGFGRSLGRTVLWAVDGFPWCLPLVGFILGLSTPGHRRVGDMAAKTFVVGKAHTGPVVVPGLTPSAPQAPAGYPPPGGYPAPGGPGQPWGAPGGGWASGAGLL